MEYALWAIIGFVTGCVLQRYRNVVLFTIGGNKQVRDKAKKEAFEKARKTHTW